MFIFTNPLAHTHFLVKNLGVKLLSRSIIIFRQLLISNNCFCLRFFNSYRVADYARSGNIATETVELQEGPLTFAHSHTIEPQLRQLGLPTALVKGAARNLVSSSSKFQLSLFSGHLCCQPGSGVPCQ